MNQLIEALMQLSQFSYLNLKRELVDLSEIAREMANELRQSSPERRAEFVIQPRVRTLDGQTGQPLAGVQVFIDGTQLGQPPSSTDRSRCGRAVGRSPCGPGGA